jgi:tyrosine-protein kinase Etk/Wzc
MRRRALAEAEANVEYLRTELDTTTAVALQQSIGRLLETELQKLMLARGTKDFAFRVIDRAEAPKRRSRPNRPMFVILATLAGGALSVLFVMIQGAQPRHNTPDSSGA